MAVSEYATSLAALLNMQIELVWSGDPDKDGTIYIGSAGGPDAWNPGNIWRFSYNPRYPMDDTHWNAIFKRIKDAQESTNQLPPPRPA